MAMNGRRASTLWVRAGFFFAGAAASGLIAGPPPELRIFILLGAAGLAFVLARWFAKSVFTALPAWFMTGIAAASGLSLAATGVFEFAALHFTSCQNLLVDGAQTAKIWLVSQGVNVYPPPGPDQYLVSIYPPLYYFVTAPLALATGNPYLAAVTVNVLSLAAICAAVWTWVRRESGSTAAAFLAVLGFAAAPGMAASPRFVRADLMAWAVSLWGAYYFFAPGRVLSRAKQAARAWIAGMVLGASLFVKQQVIALIPGCAASFILPGRKFTDSLRLGFGSLLAFGALAALAQYFTDGAYFTHAFLYPMNMAKNPGIYNWDNAVPRIIAYATANAGLLSLAAIGLARSLGRPFFRWTFSFSSWLRRRRACSCIGEGGKTTAGG